MADIYGMLMDGMRSAQAGADAKKKRGLAELIGKAYSAPQADRQQFLGQAVSLDPQAGFAASKGLGDMDDDKRAQVARQAQIFATLPDEQKAQAYPQLAAEVGSLTGQQLPGAYDAKFLPMIEKVASWNGAGGGAVPTGFQELHMKALAAGLRPGSPEYQQAMNISLGREGRAATGGFGFELIEGMDGSKRMARKNPRTGAFEVYDESTGDFVPMGGAGALNGGLPPTGGAGIQGAVGPQGVQGVVQALAGQFGGQVSSLQRSPEHNARVGGVPNSQHIAGTAGDVVVPMAQRAAFIAAARAQGLEAIDEGDHVHLELPSGRSGVQGGSPGLAVSRRPEDEAAAKANAEEAVKLDYLPRSEGIKADAAVGQALAIDRNKAGVEVETKAAAKARDAEGTLALLDEAEKLLPGATGGRLGAARDDVLGAFNYSTDGAKATAGLKLIAAELVAKVPRFEGPQSNIDVQFYREAAGDLANDKLPVAQRMAALKVMRRLRQRYAGQQADAPRSNRVNSSPPQQFGGFRILED